MGKRTLGNLIGWGVIIGGTFLAGYHGCRSQSVVYERDFFGRVTSVKLHQFGRDEKLIPDPSNPNRLIVEGNPTLNSLCDSIGDGFKWLYDNAQSLRRQTDSNTNAQGQDNYKK